MPEDTNPALAAPMSRSRTKHKNPHTLDTGGGAGRSLLESSDISSLFCHQAQAIWRMSDKGFTAARGINARMIVYFCATPPILRPARGLVLKKAAAGRTRLQADQPVRRFAITWGSYNDTLRWSSTISRRACFFIGPSTASATVWSYDSVMSGPNEFPVNASPGTGYLAPASTTTSRRHRLALHADFTGLTGTTTASHIHAATLVPFAGTAGVATTTPSFAGFPLGVTSGSFAKAFGPNISIELESLVRLRHQWHRGTHRSRLYSRATRGQGLLEYPLHNFGGGEIRGFMTLVPVVPEPTTVPGQLTALGVAALGCVARRRRR